MDYVEHPLIKEKSVEARVYQQVIFDSVRKGNSLVVLPTGLGKTQIAIMLAAHRVSQFSDLKILMMAPTRPLVLQHEETFRGSMDIPSGEIKTVTGRTPPSKRAGVWREGRLFFATPQTVERDILSGKVSLDEYSLLIFDEAHRAVGDYPYGFIAESYLSEAEKPLILGLTASPGGTTERIEKVKDNLQIENVEVRSEDDPNVEPYVQPIEMERVMLELPEPVAKIKKFLEKQLKSHLKELKKMEFLDSIQNVGKKELLEVQKKIKKGQKEMSPNPPRRFFTGMMEQAAAFRLSHCIELLESQGLESLETYLDKLASQANSSGASKSVKVLLRDPRMEKVIRLVKNSVDRIDNPKLEKAKELVMEEISENPDSRIILFAHYRDSANQLVEKLEGIDNVKPVKFIGQADRGDESGLSQKEQADILDSFRDGYYNTLVSTAVGEEGLDIPGVDLAIFYEPVPSEIRSIQRRGRTGRAGPGRVVVLIMKGTRDEAFYWSAYHKEKRMKETLRDMREDSGEDKYQKSLDNYEGN